VSDARFLTLLAVIVFAGVIASPDKEGSAAIGGLVMLFLFGAALVAALAGA
jgi:hypothetical protein